MQEKGIGPVADRDAATDEAIMGLLVEDRGPWAIGEVQRMIGNEIATADGAGEVATRRARASVRRVRLRVQNGPGGGRPLGPVLDGPRLSRDGCRQEMRALGMHEDSAMEMKDTTRVMGLRLAEDLAAEMAYVCRVDQVTVSEGIRAAIYRHIASRRADKGFQARLRERLEKDREVLERLAE